jgi:hypothetical protein
MKFPRAISLLLLFLAAITVRGQGTIVWNGPLVTFSVLSGSDWTQVTNQDSLTPNVAFARSTSKGLFNARTEGGYDSINGSPDGTLWAIGSLANYQTLTYVSWADAYGGAHNLASNIIIQSAVVHLLADDIYLGIRFTSWGGFGGGFSYERTSPLGVPEPATTSLLAIGSLTLCCRKYFLRRG